MHATKNIFTELGGKILFLDRKKAVEWYGLTALFCKVKEGDISFLRKQSVQTAELEEFSLYMKNGFENNLIEAVSPPPLKLNIDPNVLEKKIREILEKSPMKIMTAALLVGHLVSDHIDITHEFLLAFINEDERKNSFNWFSSGDGSMVKLCR